MTEIACALRNPSLRRCRARCAEFANRDRPHEFARRKRRFAEAGAELLDADPAPAVGTGDLDLGVENVEPVIVSLAVRP